jgi:hypothetical protein
VIQLFDRVRRSRPENGWKLSEREEVEMMRWEVWEREQGRWKMQQDGRELERGKGPEEGRKWGENGKAKGRHSQATAARMGREYNQEREGKEE